MGREELDALAEANRPLVIDEGQASVLVAGEAVLDARTLHRLRRRIGQEPGGARGTGALDHRIDSEPTDTDGTHGETLGDRSTVVKSPTGALTK